MNEISNLKGEIEMSDGLIDQIDKENAKILSEVENLMMLIKQEEYLSQVLQDKTKELEQHFGLMQPYMILCNKTFSKLSSSSSLRSIRSFRSENFYGSGNGNSQLKKLLVENELPILENRDRYERAVMKLKRDHIVSSTVKKLNLFF